jgi:hypothetical protein
MTIEVAEAADLYVYGYPLVYCTDEILNMPKGRNMLIPTEVPFNSFGAARQLLGPEAKFVSPNNDTLYLFAPLDVSGGPVLLHTPDTGDRYYVLQFVDAWSNNFAYVGRRATGTAAGDFLLVPSGYTGPEREGATTIEVPSDVAVIVGRVQVDGEADLGAVHALQDQFTLTPAAGTTGMGAPAVDADVSDELSFWERFRTYLRAFPPPAADKEFVELAERAGLTSESSPLRDPSSPLATILIDGAARGKEKIESAGGGHAAPGS